MDRTKMVRAVQQLSIAVEAIATAREAVRTVVNECDVRLPTNTDDCLSQADYWCAIELDELTKELEREATDA